ncbi:MAG TPA: hypothetical protein VFH75_00065 [Actinomycetota bacterium]|nr:hypothetical protein [Actinomycetota bacterium]
MRVSLAIVLGLVIFLVGTAVVRAIAQMRPKETIEPEDVADLDVFFVCGECGTEFRVERVGELQIPRHCGESMRVERRPRNVG